MKEQSLYDVMRWIKQMGDHRALDRVRLKMLSRTLKERIKLDQVTEQTNVSEDYLQVFILTASEVVGTPYAPERRGDN